MPEKNPKNRQVRGFKKGAADLAQKLSIDYRENIKMIAKGLAGSTDAENVQEHHVREAHQILTKYGQSRTPWWRRWETLSAGGGLLTGIAFQVKYALKYVGIAEPSSVGGVTVAIILIGGVLTFVGLFGHKFWAYSPNGAGVANASDGE